jgi:AcrR family transcriptional regulator
VPAGARSDGLRPYAGVDGPTRLADRRERLLDAALELLGTVGSAGTSVRAICRRAQLTTRYFYESFSGLDDCVVAVFERCADELAAATMTAVAGPELDDRARVRAGVRAIVMLVAGDPRRGRVLFSSAVSTPAIAEVRQRSAHRFAALLGSHARQALGVTDGPWLQATAHFLVGGLAEVLVAWLDGALTMTPDDVVEICAAFFDSAADRWRPPSSTAGQSASDMP